MRCSEGRVKAGAAGAKWWPTPDVLRLKQGQSGGSVGAAYQRERQRGSGGKGKDRQDR